MNHFVPSTMPDEGTGVLLLFHLIDRAVPSFFAPDRPLVVARAPGRLDVMGGVAAKGGGLTLQIPLAEAACIAVQERPDDALHVWSPGRDGDRAPLVSMQLADLGLPDRPLAYAQARALFAAEPRDRWAAHVFGCLLALAREHGVRPTRGLALLLRCDVPVGRGVAAAAAIEVAAMAAFASHYGVELPPRELALLCQRVATEIVGVRGNVADRMVAAGGEQDELLALRCRPCEREGSIPMPADLEILGLDGGAADAAVEQQRRRFWVGARAGAALLAGLRPRGDDCSPAEFDAQWATHVPLELRGAALLAQFGELLRHEIVDPDAVYPVRAALRLQLAEHERSVRFAALLRAAGDGVARRLGELMFAAHADGAAHGLGSAASDFLVAEVQRRIAAGGALYGARVCASGGGNTVAILGARATVWHEALRIKKAWHSHSGCSAEIFRWSSPGAAAFGTLRLEPRAVT